MVLMARHKLATLLERFFMPKRHILFLHGYDLRGAKHYHAMMERELARFSSARAVPCEISQLQRKERSAGVCEGVGSAEKVGADAGDMDAFWTMSSRWGTESVEAQVHFLGWRDMAVRDFKIAPIKRMRQGLSTFAAFAFGRGVRGGYAAVFRQNWQAGLFFIYPAFVLTVFALLSAVCAFFGAKELFRGNWVVGVAILAAAVASPWTFHWLSRFAEKRTYLWYLVNDWISIRRLAQDKDPEMSARIEEFATKIIDVCDSSGPDEEVLVIGHSSGSFLAVYAMERVLANRPDFGKDRRRPILLTLGSAFSYVGEFSGAVGFGRALTRLSGARHVDWVDVFAPQDIMSVGRFDPVRAYASEEKGPLGAGPKLVSARISDGLDQALYEHIRWRFFDLHFCYFCATSSFAGKTAEFYDLYDVITGVSPRTPLGLSGSGNSEPGN